jgi:hypothetical protein
MLRCKARKKSSREAYIDIRRVVRFAANPDFIGTNERFVKAFGFYRQGKFSFIIALPYRDAHPVNSPSIILYHLHPLR